MHKKTSIHESPSIVTEDDNFPILTETGDMASAITIILDNSLSIKRRYNQVANFERKKSDKLEDGSLINLERVKTKERSVHTFPMESMTRRVRKELHYIIFSAADKKSAESFLEKIDIKENYYFVVVKTPELILKKDKRGVYIAKEGSY